MMILLLAVNYFAALRVKKKRRSDRNSEKPEFFASSDRIDWKLIMKLDKRKEGD